MSLLLFVGTFVIFDLSPLIFNSYFHVKKKKKGLLENLNETVRFKYSYVGGNMMAKYIVIDGISVTGSCYFQVVKFCVP